MGVALLLPMTFTMAPETGLIVLGAIYCGAIFGGSISAILIHTPGTPASAATAIEGYQLTLQGKAGKALAVDRELFAGKVTELVEAEPNITLVRKAIADLDDPALEGFERVVISAGPLASESLSASIARAVGAEHLYFYVCHRAHRGGGFH